MNMLQHRPTMLRQLRLLAATGAIALLAACSTLDRGQPPQLERKASWVVLPFANHTETPLAGQRAEAIAQALLSGRHELGLTSPVVSGRSEVADLVLTASTSAPAAMMAGASAKVIPPMAQSGTFSSRRA